MDLKSWRAIFINILATFVMTNGLANIADFTCDFEENDCGFTEYMPASDLEWVWGAASNGIGPGADNTVGTSAGHYLYLDTKAPSTSLIARTGSPFFATTTAAMCVELSVFSSSWSTITLTGFAIAPEFKSFMDLGKFGGSREGMWKKAMLEIRPQNVIFQLIFVAQITSNPSGLSLAIDDIQLIEGPCPALDTFECTFEDQNICGFKYDTAADFDFIRQNMGTPTSTTGPTMDHTLNNANGYYVRIEANKKALGSSARLISPAIQRTHSFMEPSCLIFWYHMYGRHMGYLNVYAMTTDTIPSTTTLSEAAMVWSLNGDQGDGWKMAEVAIDMANDFVILFEALRGNGNKGDAAIDDVQVIRSADCPIPVSTQPTTDRTTLSSTTTTPEVDTSTMHQPPSTVSTSGSVAPTSLLDITSAKLSTHPTTSKVGDNRTVSEEAIQEHTTLTERTTPSLPKSTGSESVQSEAPSERTTDVASTPEGPTTVSTVLNTRPTTVISTTFHKQTSLMEHTSFPTVLKVSTPESVRSTTSSRHTTNMVSTSMTRYTDLPNLSRTNIPDSVSPTTLHEHTTLSEATSRPTVSEVNTAESALSTVSSKHTSPLSTTSVDGSTTVLTISTAPRSITPGSMRPTTSHQFTAPIEPRTLATDSKINTSESLRSTASSDQTANVASISILASIANTSVSKSNSPGSVRPTTSHELTTPIEPRTSATVSKANTSKPVQITVSTDNNLTVSTRNTVTFSELGSTGTHSSPDPFDLDTSANNTTGTPSTMTQPEMSDNVSAKSEETLRTLVSTSISNTSTLLPVNSSTDYTPSANETTLDLTAVSKTEDGTEATIHLEVSERQSSATPTKDVSEGPSIGNGSFFQNNKVAVISLGVVLGGLCIGATAALITRFLKPNGTGLSMKHRGHNRVGALEATKVPSMEPSTNTLMMTEKMSGLPSIESVESHNIYYT